MRQSVRGREESTNSAEAETTGVSGNCRWGGLSGMGEAREKGQEVDEVGKASPQQPGEHVNECEFSPKGDGEPWKALEQGSGPRQWP